MIMDFIEGNTRNQIILLPDSIDEYVDANNPVRVIDAYVNSLDLDSLGFQKSQPNNTGRPMYNPKDMLKLYLYGYMNRVRSSRRLEVETKRNLEAIWLLRKLSPDHKTIARFRHDNSSALKNVFKDFVQLCIKLNLYGKELVAIDGSKFPAVNSKDRNFNKKKLDDRIARIEEKIDEYLKQADAIDKDEAADAEHTSEEIKSIISELSTRKELYQSFLDKLAEGTDYQLSLTDPDSRLMLANGKMDVCFNIQSAVDAKNKMIVDFEVTNKVSDKNLLSVMSENARNALNVDTLTVVADTGYNAASDIAKCIREDITPHVAGGEIDICIPSDEPTGEIIEEFDVGRTVYIPERNIAICPLGQVLYPKSYKKQIHKGIFRNNAACRKCTNRCIKSEHAHGFEIDIPAHEWTKKYNDRDLFITQIHVKPDKELIRKRKSIVEHPFGTIKRHHYGDYCLTKGIPSVTGEYALTFIAYNFRRAINILGTTKMIELIGV
jgi:transposase